MKDARCSRGASDVLVVVRVVGIFTNLLASDWLQVRLLTGNLDVDHRFKLSHGGYNGHLAKSFHRSMVGLFFHREAFSRRLRQI